MARPLIAITGGAKQDRPEWKLKHTYWAGCPVDYVAAIQASGGAPVLLPFNADEESVRAILEKCGGLLLTGGGDIDPSRYGQKPHSRTGMPQPKRDAMETAAVKIALKLNLPILGICRGIQMLNVVLGGTIVQDIPSQVQSKITHSFDGIAPDMAHDIVIEPDSLLAGLLGRDPLGVNSRHHQAVDALGDGLRISAKADDGVVEAVESNCGRPILAVQFHPENIVGSFPIFRKLFDWLIIEASKYNA